MAKKKDYQFLATSAIYNLISGSFALMLGNCHEFVNNKPADGEADELTEINRELFDIFINYHKANDDMNKDFYTDINNEQAEKFIALRKRVNQYRNRLLGLKAAVEMHSFIIHYFDMKKRGSIEVLEMYKKKESALLFSLHELFDELSEKEKKLLKTYISAYIPLMVARGAHNDYLKKCLTDIFAYFNEEDFDGILNFYKVSLGMDTDADLFYPTLAAKVKALSGYEADYEKGNDLPESVYEQIAAEIDELFEEINKAVDRLSLLKESINYMMILYFSNTDFGLISDLDPVVEDLYYLFIENYATGSLEDFSFDERLESLMSDAVDRITASSDDFSMLLNKTKYENLNDTDRKLADLFSSISGVFYAPLGDIEDILLGRSFVEEFEIISKERARESAGQIAEIIQNSLAGKSARVRKLYNRVIMKYVPCLYSDKEFIEYIYNAFENSSLFERAFSLNFIFNMLDTVGVNGWRSEDEGSESNSNV